jgi:methionyl-tRNA synthetase
MMRQFFSQQYPFMMGWGYGLTASMFLLMIAWSIVWKGLALWRAAKNGHKGWFIALLVINTLGILEIVYLLSFGKEVDQQGEIKK